jgi:hypothetical protein
MSWKIIVKNFRPPVKDMADVEIISEKWLDLTDFAQLVCTNFRIIKNCIKKCFT